MRAHLENEDAMRRPLTYLRNRYDLLIALLALLVLLFVLAYPRLSRGEPVAAAPGLETAVFAGGCFWGVEAVFEHVRGVRDVRSGYAGGDARAATYERVSSGDTGHAESVEVVFDPKVVSYGQLLSVFFTVAHDPTQKDRQGPDHGPQYRSAIFFASDAQKRAAQEYIRQLQPRLGARPVVTQVVPLREFFPAERYHQDFMRLNPMHPYILVHDRPKVAHLAEAFPKLFVADGLAAR
jgi:peptide-methionine (S)-S-oxide reductase